MTAFGIQGVKINGAQFAGVRGTQFERARSFHSDGSDGQVHETHHAILMSKPVIEFSSLALKTLLVALGTSGTSEFPLVALDGAAGIVMYGAKAAASAPGYAGGTVHMTKTGLNGVVVMESVKWSVGQPAMMDLRALCIATVGTADPIVSATAALPTQLFNTEAFVLSALTLNGSAIDTVESVELSVDHKFDSDGNTGLPFPTFIKGAGTNGRAAIRLSAEIRDVVQAEGSGAVSLVFTSLANGGTLGAATVTFTLNGGWTLEESISGGNAGAMTKRLVVRPYHNGTTKPLTWGVT